MENGLNKRVQPPLSGAKKVQVSYRGGNKYIYWSIINPGIIVPSSKWLMDGDQLSPLGKPQKYKLPLWSFGL